MSHRNGSETGATGNAATPWRKRQNALLAIRTAFNNSVRQGGLAELTLPQFQQVMQMLDSTWPRQSSEEVFAEADRNGNGTVDLMELVVWLFKLDDLAHRFERPALAKAKIHVLVSLPNAAAHATVQPVHRKASTSKHSIPGHRNA